MPQTKSKEVKRNVCHRGPHGLKKNGFFTYTVSNKSVVLSRRGRIPWNVVQSLNLTQMSTTRIRPIPAQ